MTGKTTGDAPPPSGPGVIGRAVRWVFGLIVGFFLRVALVFALLIAGTTAYFYSTLPGYGDLFDGRATGSVILYDKDGDVFAWRGEQYGGDLTVADASPHLINAVIAAEDKRYFSHFGLDPRGIARAMVVNLQAGRFVQGGSTLTQQVAKNVFLSAERTLERKIKEVPMALALELRYSKEEILSIYLNRVYLGAGTYGFEAASQRYFGKPARALVPAEAAMLAGLLRAPSRLAPTNGLDRARARANTIARLMFEQGYLTEVQMLEIQADPASLSTAAAARRGAAFADWVIEQGGEDRFLHLLRGADVQILTTFDAEAQSAAEAAVAFVFDTKVREGSRAEAAVVIMDHDGAVRAMVGGRNDRTGGFNRVTQAFRQTGSAFKPIVYAAALEAGMAPGDMVLDAPLTIKSWSPSNYGGGFQGEITLTQALAQSVNTAAVRLSERVGRSRVRDLAAGMGVTSPLAPGPAVALGTSEATLLDMASVYAVIANGGSSAKPYGIREMQLRGDLVPIPRGRAAQRVRVISPRTTGFLSYMLEEVVQTGTGQRARIDGIAIAGKTGTTQKARDAWFIGYTAKHVVGVWMGYDDNRPLTGVTGGGLPADIWRETVVRLYTDTNPGSLNSRQPIRPGIVPSVSSRQTKEPTLVERIFQDVVDTLVRDN